MSNVIMNGSFWTRQVPGWADGVVMWHLILAAGLVLLLVGFMIFLMIKADRARDKYWEARNKTLRQYIRAKKNRDIVEKAFELIELGLTPFGYSEIHRYVQEQTERQKEIQAKAKKEKKSEKKNRN